jgi:hypothetical protein
MFFEMFQPRVNDRSLRNISARRVFFHVVDVPICISEPYVDCPGKVGHPLVHVVQTLVIHKDAVSTANVENAVLARAVTN